MFLKMSFSSGGDGTGTSSSERYWAVITSTTIIAFLCGCCELHKEYQQERYVYDSFVPVAVVAVAVCDIVLARRWLGLGVQNDNHIGEEGATALAPALAHLVQLTRLDLVGNSWLWVCGMRGRECLGMLLWISLLWLVLLLLVL